MDRETIKANLNLNAVLQNLEDLVKLDPEMGALTRSWAVSIQFTVLGGASAYVEFSGGVCRHGAGKHANPSVKLLFVSASHLNSMFDGKGTPIPLKGFSRLSFLQKEFSKLTDRLTYYLKPGAHEGAADAQYVRINTILSLYTAVYAARELAKGEDVSGQVAKHTPSGPVQIEVLPEGPSAYVVFDKGDLRVGKGPVDKPLAKMSFRSIDVAHELLAGRLDAFLAVAQQDVLLQGQLPMIDNLNLILDRVAGYLS